MSYIVNSTAGTIIATVADGTVNTTATSLVLIGKNYAGYGIFLNENYVQLLENFSSGTAPSVPLTGQLWYDSTNDILKVYNSQTNIWKPISSSISQATAPSAGISVTGDIWWDTSNAQLKVWSGSTWVTIGPAYTSTSGTSGPVTEVINATDGNPRAVIKFYVSNQVIAILSRDTTFIPQTSISGFGTIVPGLNLISQSTLAGAQFTGATTGASTLGGLAASQFLRSDIAATTNYAFGAAAGITIGSDLSIDTSSGTAVFSETTTNKNIRFDINRNGVTSTALTINASTNTVAIANALAVSGSIIASEGLIIASGKNITPAANVTSNLGSTTSRFANVYATLFVGQSITSQYADLAERFEADAIYAPGTVVELGGLKEITAAVCELTENVFGVISTAAGFLMNSGAGTNLSHPPVAVNGRVPVRVIGKVNKGDRLVSAGNGLARAAHRSEMTAFNVIGRALENKLSSNEGTIEAIVKLNS